jgi:hypothetical protein
MPNDSAAAALIFTGTSTSGWSRRTVTLPPEPRVTRHAALYRMRAKPSPAPGSGNGLAKKGSTPASAREPAVSLRLRQRARIPLHDRRLGPDVGATSSGVRQRGQPHRACDPLPPGDRYKRHPHRLRRRSAPQAPTLNCISFGRCFGRRTDLRGVPVDGRAPMAA